MGKEYIEREAALNAAHKIGKKEYDLGRVSNTATVMVVEDYLRAIPTADVVERKKGKWKTAYLDHEEFGIRPRVWYCSECQQISSFRTNYCPDCGADMREDDV